MFDLSLESWNVGMRMTPTMVSRTDPYNVKITYKVLFHIPTFQGIGLKVNI